MNLSKPCPDIQQNTQNVADDSHTSCSDLCVQRSAFNILEHAKIVSLLATVREDNLRHMRVLNRGHPTGASNKHRTPPSIVLIGQFAQEHLNGHICTISRIYSSP